ncbi:MAG: phage head-tail joining protein [Janthinobacterium lividum]
MPGAATTLLLSTRLAELDTIISSGVASGSYDGKNVTFRSFEELQTIRDGLLRQMGLRGSVRRTAVGYSGGF